VVIYPLTSPTDCSDLEALYRPPERQSEEVRNAAVTILGKVLS
jgi:hypothetical protein